MKKYTLRTFIQESFLTIEFFMQNDLITYASACAFGFLFSLLPILIMTASILIGVLDTSPEALDFLYDMDSSLLSVIDVPQVIDFILHFNSGLFFKIVLGVFIFWMARRLFMSTVKGIRCIFHTESQRRPFIYQLIIIASEVVLVVSLSLIIFLISSGSTLLQLPFFKSFIPPFVYSLLSTIISFTPVILMFFIVSISYRVAPGIKLPWSKNFLATLCCTVSFFVFSYFSSYFTDIAKYNMIYGVLSAIIMLLLRVFVFFILYLFFAQALFVHHFFNQLLLAELYLLPSRDTENLILLFRRLLFVDPDYFINKKSIGIEYGKGSIIYNAGDASKDIFYIAQGSVTVTKNNFVEYYDRGSFFGEVACILGKNREESATAVSDVHLIKIDAEDFLFMLEKNPEANKKALSRLSSYFSQHKEFS